MTEAQGRWAAPGTVFRPLLRGCAGMGTRGEERLPRPQPQLKGCQAERWAKLSSRCANLSWRGVQSCCLRAAQGVAPAGAAQVSLQRHGGKSPVFSCLSLRRATREHRHFAVDMFHLRMKWYSQSPVVLEFHGVSIFNFYWLWENFSTLPPLINYLKTPIFYLDVYKMPQRNKRGGETRGRNKKTFMSNQ